MKNQKAYNEMMNRLAEANELQKELQAKIEKLAETENPNWGHTGDAGRIVENLKDLLGHNG